MITSLFNTDPETVRSRNRIVWQKAKILPDKVVLLSEMQLIAQQVVREESYFNILFSRYGECVVDSIYTKNSKYTGVEDTNPKEAIEPLLVKLKDVETHVLKYVFDVPEDVASEEIFRFLAQRNQQKKISNLARYAGSSRYDPKNYIVTEEDIKRETLAGVLIGDYYQAFSEAAGLAFTGYSPVKDYEQGAITRGEGQMVFDYWQAVFEAKDYGDHFANRPRPKGGKLDHNGGWGTLTDLLPDLGGNLQDAPQPVYKLG